MRLCRSCLLPQVSGSLHKPTCPRSRAQVRSNSACWGIEAGPSRQAAQGPALQAPWRQPQGGPLPRPDSPHQPWPSNPEQSLVSRNRTQTSLSTLSLFHTAGRRLLFQACGHVSRGLESGLNLRGAPLVIPRLRLLICSGTTQALPSLLVSGVLLSRWLLCCLIRAVPRAASYSLRSPGRGGQRNDSHTGVSLGREVSGALGGGCPHFVSWLSRQPRSPRMAAVLPQMHRGQVDNSQARA